MSLFVRDDLQCLSAAWDLGRPRESGTGLPSESPRLRTLHPQPERNLNAGCCRPNCRVRCDSAADTSAPSDACAAATNSTFAPYDISMDEVHDNGIDCDIWSHFDSSQSSLRQIRDWVRFAPPPVRSLPAIIGVTCSTPCSRGGMPRPTSMSWREMLLTGSLRGDRERHGLAGPGPMPTRGRRRAGGGIRSPQLV